MEADIVDFYPRYLYKPNMDSQSHRFLLIIIFVALSHNLVTIN